MLFDRRDPASVLWPKRATFELLLNILNASELACVWGEDETIGWVYQYFNGADERRKMREESPAPRNSRELAIRNQFFTPQYVVRFVTENTLGRIWYEMRRARTSLPDRCEYLVPNSGGELAARLKKDPRDLRVLDPACGSGHFLLYAFDLLLTIYEEAYGDPESPKSEATGHTLAEDYSSLDALQKAMPGLIIAHNLHGVDIDPRCAQIAQLALWMRAQRSYNDVGIVRSERPQIRRSNVVIAEPLVADERVAAEFVARLGDVGLGRVFTGLVEALNLVGNLGLLLNVEQLLARQPKAGQSGDLFAPPEARIRAALEKFIAEDGTRSSTRRRLFVEDAAHGIGLIAIADKTFDVVVMNPPFGDSCERGRDRIEDLLDDAGRDIGAAFVLRATRWWAPHGYVGVLLPTGTWFKPAFEVWRDEVFWGKHALHVAAHFGGQVLDGATVNVSAFVTAGNAHAAATILRCVEKSPVEHQLTMALASARSQTEDDAVVQVVPQDVAVLPGKPFAYWLSTALRDALRRLPTFEGTGGTVKVGAQSSDELRFSRCWWEVSLPSSRWRGFVKSGEFSPLWDDCPWVAVNKDVLSSEVEATGKARVQGLAFFDRPGVMFPRKSVIGFNPRLHPAGYGFGDSAPVAFPSSVGELALLGFLSSRPVEYLIGLFVGELQGQAGVYPLHYQVGVVQRLPWPGIPSAVENGLSAAADRSVRALQSLSALSECSLAFDGLPRFSMLPELLYAVRARESEVLEEVLRNRAQVDELVYGLFGFTDQDQQAVSAAMQDLVPPAQGKWRRWFRADGTDYTERSVASNFLSWLVSIAFGRNIARFSHGQRPNGRATGGAAEGCQSRDVLVDDIGHEGDISAAVDVAARQLGLDDSTIATALGWLGWTADLRSWLAREFFSEHVARFTCGRRKSPIYWQLVTSSGNYSVWLYIHALTKDTLFRVQNDYVTPKLAHEERRLESMSFEQRHKVTAAERKALAAQEALVEELRAFLGEVKRVAPLWKPNLDDGVIINFAPLWRLVPHHKSWQKELKATWNALCEGKYDWAHLAMHLWPERVVPKCATDRSLAIAHGLEDVFWVEGADRKWKARTTPLKSVEELVRERSSPAVKAALKNLIEAPTASGDGRARGRHRAVSAATTVGGNP